MKKQNRTFLIEILGVGKTIRKTWKIYGSVKLSKRKFTNLRLKKLSAHDDCKQIGWCRSCSGHHSWGKNQAQRRGEDFYFLLSTKDFLEKKS